MDLIIATGNRHKFDEIVYGLSGLNLSITSSSPQIIEDGKNYFENAVKKARNLYDTYGKMSLADDSGLEIEALNGEPGLYSARYLDEKLTYQERNLRVLELLESVGPSKRKAVFRCVIVLALSSSKIMTFEGTCPGEITFELRGDNSFGYDPIFLLPILEKTFAELDMGVKNSISHRGIALSKVRNFLKNEILNFGA